MKLIIGRQNRIKNSKYHILHYAYRSVNTCSQKLNVVEGIVQVASKSRSPPYREPYRCSQLSNKILRCCSKKKCVAPEKSFPQNLNFTLIHLIIHHKTRKIHFTSFCFNHEINNKKH